MNDNIDKNEIRMAIDRLQEDHPAHFTFDVTMFDNGTDFTVIQRGIDMVAKKCQDDADINIICEMAKLYLEGVRPMEKQKQEWIPVTYRDMDAEEIEQFEAEYGTLAEEDKKVFSCQMPEDGQDILISTKYGVYSDTCCYDGSAYWLEMHDDWEGVDAWMPYPKPYNKEGEKK